jgi:hypothetical protein
MIDGLEVLGDSIDAHEVPIDTIDDLEGLAELQGTAETAVGPKHLVIHMFCQRTMKESIQTMAESEYKEQQPAFRLTEGSRNV